MHTISTFFGGLWHGFTGMPLLSKIIIGGIVLAVVVVGTVMVVMTVSIMAYDRTTETPLARIVHDGNTLIINGVAHRNLNGTSLGHRLYWNGKAVSKRYVDAGDGQPEQDAPIDPDDQKGVVIAPVPNAVKEYRWTVWVDPGQFSRADFDAMVACVRQHRAGIDQQIANEPEPKPNGSFREGFGPAHIGTLVYGRGNTVNPRLYTGTTPWGDAYELSIDPNGRVDLRQEFLVMNLGEVTLENGQRILHWAYAEEMTVLGRDLPGFKNERGALLSTRYQLRHTPNTSQLFFRQTATHYEQIYVSALNPADKSRTLGVNVKAVDLKYPGQGLNYDGGTIRLADPDQPRAKAVFHWQPWADRPITETDLRQFRNEQGQSLGDVVEFLKD